MEALFRTLVELGHETTSLHELRAAALARVVTAVGAETALWGTWGALGCARDSAIVGLDVAVLDGARVAPAR